MPPNDRDALRLAVNAGTAAVLLEQLGERLVGIAVVDAPGHVVGGQVECIRTSRRQIVDRDSQLGIGQRGCPQSILALRLRLQLPRSERGRTDNGKADRVVQGQVGIGGPRQRRKPGRDSKKDNGDRATRGEAESRRQGDRHKTSGHA